MSLLRHSLFQSTCQPQSQGKMVQMEAPILPLQEAKPAVFTISPVTQVVPEHTSPVSELLLWCRGKLHVLQHRNFGHVEVKPVLEGTVLQTRFTGVVMRGRRAVKINAL